MSEKLEVLQLIPSIDEEASGPSYSVTKLNENVSKIYKSKLFTISNKEEIINDNISKFKESQIFYKLSFSFKLIQSISSELKKNKDIILHNHSLWLPLNYLPFFFNKIFKCYYIISPRGTLSSWSLKNSRFKKNFFWFLIQKRVLKNAIAFHATSDLELQEIRKLGFKQPIAVIPNGIDPHRSIKNKNKNYYSLSKEFSVIFLSRIHEKKGLENLIEAWGEINFPETSIWNLKIFGKGNDKYINFLKDICISKNIRNISINAPLYGEKKISEYINSDIFILNSFSENFGQSVLESLNLGTPVIVSDQMPWKDVELMNCGWVVKNDIKSIVKLFETKILRTDKNTLYNMGLNGINYSKSHYGWKELSTRMFQFYDWIKNGGERPPFIYD